MGGGRRRVGWGPDDAATAAKARARAGDRPRRRAARRRARGLRGRDFVTSVARARDVTHGRSAHAPPDSRRSVDFRRPCQTERETDEVQVHRRPRRSPAPSRARRSRAGAS